MKIYNKDQNCWWMPTPDVKQKEYFLPSKSNWSTDRQNNPLVEGPQALCCLLYWKLVHNYFSEHIQCYIIRWNKQLYLWAIQILRKPILIPVWYWKYLNLSSIVLSYSYFAQESMYLFYIHFKKLTKIISCRILVDKELLIDQCLLNFWYP